MNVGLSRPTFAVYWLRFMLRNRGGLHYFRHWRQSLRGQGSPLEDGMPWMPYDAIAWMDAYLKPNMSVFEWGSGGSTVFLAARVGRLVSVEHDAGWYQRVGDRMGTTTARVSRLLHEPQKRGGEESRYASSAPEYAEHSFVDYVTAIAKCGGDAFDLVIVDGRARVACIREAYRRTRPGGYILLDDSARP